MNLHFAWPWLVVLLPLPLLISRWLRPMARNEAALTALVPALLASANATERTGSNNAPWWTTAALWGAWLALIVAVCRPQLMGDAVSAPTTGRDLLLAVDISGSMNTEDMALGDRMITRLDAMKLVVQDFIQRRSGDRVGLIVFGTNAYLYVPLTFDRNTVAQMLLDLRGNEAGGRTAVGDAVGLAIKNLRDRPAHDRVLVLLTDGASNAGELTTERAAQIAAEEKIRVHTIGFGGDTLRLPGLFGLDAQIVNPSSDLDEGALRQIATRTGGHYFRARDPAQLTQIYTALDAIEPVAQSAAQVRPRTAMHHWPLSVAFALSLLLAARSIWVARHA